MIAPDELAARVFSDTVLQESHWLEWKSAVNLGQREWQARVARFILGAANRPPGLAGASHEGRAFMLLGVEPGRAVGTTEVDLAVVTAGLARYLGSAGPCYVLDYVAFSAVTIAVVTVQPSPSGSRPFLARGTHSGTKLIVQDGRIYIRRDGATEEATSKEVDDMLTERVSVRIAAGPRWPLQAVDAWRDGNKVHIRQERGDILYIRSPDNFTNLTEMARERPALPAQVPKSVSNRVAAAFDPLLALADSQPDRAVQDAWSPLQQIAEKVYRGLLGREPHGKVIDMVADLASADLVEGGWVNVAYPLYYWPIDQQHHELQTTVGAAKTYLILATALVTALLLADESAPTPLT
ncbi:MAG: hypothetical protein M3186_16035 [Actinomycetota bacterium]|nr:hypothetical protein [Actinomycetota bacterium]